MFKMHPDNLGEFVEVDFGHTFTYRKTTDPWAIKHGLIHEVDVGVDTRFAHVKKTRCIMSIDENADGTPLTETWKIRRHTMYDKS